jgi:hypothetical protein
VAEICRFYGIVIAIYTRGEERHGRAHVHASYGDYVASYAIDNGERLAGRAGPTMDRDLRAWIAQHRGELMEVWGAAKEGRPTWRIEPLK